MSISPRSTCRWSSALGLIGVVAIVAAQPPQKPQTVPPFLEEFQTGKLRELTPFLDDFNARNDPLVVTETIQFTYLVKYGPWSQKISGYWARAAGKQPLPVVLVLFDEGSPATTNWMRTNAQHLASIGYAVLAMPLPEDSNLLIGGQQVEVVKFMQWLRG